MYFIELLVKKFLKKEKLQGYNPMLAPEDEDVACEHIFMPVDSTGEILACTKCGLVVNKKDMKKKNIFGGLSGRSGTV